jgi:hypothetical protein
LIDTEARKRGCRAQAKKFAEDRFNFTTEIRPHKSQELLMIAVASRLPVLELFSAFENYCAGQHAVQRRMPLYQTVPTIAPAIT